MCNSSHNHQNNQPITSSFPLSLIIIICISSISCHHNAVSHCPSCIPLSCILQLFLGLSPSTLSTSLSTSPTLPLAQPHPPFLSLTHSPSLPQPHPPFPSLTLTLPSSPSISLSQPHPPFPSPLSTSPSISPSLNLPPPSPFLSDPAQFPAEPSLQGFKNTSRTFYLGWQTSHHSSLFSPSLLLSLCHTYCSIAGMRTPSWPLSPITVLIIRRRGADI